MSDEACRLPATSADADLDPVRRMLAAKRIAVVGLSDDPSRASYGVAGYLRSVGKEIIPVNPNAKTVMGIPAYPSLRDVPGPIDLVDVFRRPQDIDQHVDDLIAKKPKAVWFQLGIRNDAAAKRLVDAGIDVVQDRCLLVDHRRYAG